jgi:crotonobetainyl-CoA:carnitine CoA-transferase CaiB-like acyl-CoA transferase
MAQTMLYVNEHAHDHLWDRPLPDGVIRSFQPEDYPVLSAANGESVVIAGHPADNGTFELYMAAIERPDLATDPRLATMAGRLEHLPSLFAALDEWASAMPDANSIEERASRYKLACGQMRSVADVCSTDWAIEREAVVEVTDRGGGVIRLPNAPWRFDGCEIRTAGEPRYRGEDNRPVLRELLGLDDEELTRLEADGVLTSRVPTTKG